MPKLTVDLPTDVSIALRRASNDLGAAREDTAVIVLRDALTALGLLEKAHALDDYLHHLKDPPKSASKD